MVLQPKKFEVWTEFYTDWYQILPSCTQFHLRVSKFTDRYRFILTKNVRFLLTHYYVPTSEPLCLVQVQPLTFPRPPPSNPVPPPLDPAPLPAQAPSCAASLRWPPALNDRISPTGTVVYLQNVRILPTGTRAIIYRRGLNSTNRNRFLPTERPNSSNRD